MAKCFCGCGEEATAWKGEAVFAPHHSKKERGKLRYQMYARRACEGTLAPSSWKICGACGEWFPIFKETHGHAETPNSCPEFVSQPCRGAYARLKRAEKKVTRHEKKELPKKFRLDECCQHGLLCARHVICSDRECLEDSSKRLWDYEIFGPGCYTPPGDVEVPYLTSSLGATHSTHADLSQT